MAKPLLTKYRTQAGFTLLEIMTVIAIIGVILALVQGSFMASLRKTRDAKRKSDLSQIAKALETYYQDRGVYPAADLSGNIVGCGPTDALIACTWNTDAWEITDPVSGDVLATYFAKLPGDTGSLRQYYYSSGIVNNQGYFQLYAKLEATKDDSSLNFNGVTLQTYTGTNCGGSDDCTYGISSTNVKPDYLHALAP